MRLNPFVWPFRWQCVTGFVVCVALYAYAIYVQFAQGIEPCNLCIFQRIAVIALAIVFLVAAIHDPAQRGRRVYGLLLLLSACGGIGVAVRHLWVQSQPRDPFAGCAPGWNYMIENFPLSKAIRMAFEGSDDCSQINWTFLGLPMPFWTLVCFALLGAGALWAGFSARAAGRRST